MSVPRIGAALLTVALGLTLAGCVSGPGTDEAARSAVNGFIAAIHDGDGEAALEFSTTSIDDVACTGLLAKTSMPAPEVGDVVVSGTTGLAKVEYATAEGDASLSLELERTDDGWKVVLPESFRIRTPVPPATVAQVDIEDACTLRGVDGYFQTIALPGSYSLYLSDPVGLFPKVLGRAAVPQAASETQYFRDFAPEIERQITSNLLAVQIQDEMFACIESGFTSTHCPDGLPVADESQDLSRPGDLVSDAVPRADVFSDDGETWRFESDPLQFRIQVNGTLVDVPFTYTGRVELNSDGDITAVFD